MHWEDRLNEDQVIQVNDLLVAFAKLRKPSQRQTDILHDDLRTQGLYDKEIGEVSG